MRELYRFSKYTAVGVSTFLLDLAMLYAAVTYLGVPYYVATPCAFLLAVTVNYIISRRHVFHGTERSWHGGYAYFIIIALSAAAITTLLVAAFVSYLSFNYLVARTLTAGIVGMGGYIVNLLYNFKMYGKHPESLPNE